VENINVAAAPPVGAVNPAKASMPVFAPVKVSELQQAGLAGDLTPYLGRLFEVE
jgi:hypothetical protein